MTAFAARHPALFQVTWRASLAGIAADGLLSARRLAERHGHADPATLTANRCRRVQVGPFVLRRQGMSDKALRPRLDPAITVEDWRRFINNQVFLFPTEQAARRFAASEPDHDQALLCFETRAVAAVAAVHTCRYNNGYVDRRPLSAPRLRAYADYRPVADWRGEPVAEVTVENSVPPGTAFTVLPSS